MQRSAQKAAHLLLACIIALASFIMYPLEARAATNHDDVLVPASSLTLVPAFAPTACSVDFSSNWVSEFGSRLGQSDLASFNNRKASGVTLGRGDDGFGLNPVVLQVYWWESADLPDTATFTQWELKANPTRWGQLYLTNNCEIRVSVFTPTGSIGIAAKQSSSSHYQPYWFEGIFVDYGLGYEGDWLPTGKKYVALGDSYSSGEGAFNYYATSGGCHRSEDSYPVYLKSVMGISNFDFEFAACSGAVTDDIFTQNPNNTAENAQFSKLGNRTEVVTLTIGGNDIDFAGIMNKCVSKNDHSGDDCKFDTSITGPLANRLNALAGTPQSGVYAPGGRTIHAIETVITQIAPAAPNAKIYIAGYPELFGSSSSNFIQDSSAPGDYKCAAWGAGFASVSYSDAQWLNSMASQLNSVIENAVNSLSSMDVTYVPNTKFDGHGLCDTSSSYILGAITDTFFNVQSESFHPNVTGMENGYGVAFSELID